MMLLQVLFALHFCYPAMNPKTVSPIKRKTQDKPTRDNGVQEASWTSPLMGRFLSVSCRHDQSQQWMEPSGFRGHQRGTYSNTSVAIDVPAEGYSMS